MNALISASDVKTFFSALQCLSRFSETFWLSCDPRHARQVGRAHIRLSAINPTNSAFCMFKFDPDFFLSVTTRSNRKIECQIQLKTVLSILRAGGKSIERCELELIDEGEECRFSVKLHCHHGILKVHKLTYEPKRGLQPTADPNPPNFFCINAQTAQEWIEHFLQSSRNGEITFHCTPDSCSAKSKEEEVPEGKGRIRSGIQTEAKIALDDFREYSVLEDTLMTFSLREFKATVTLAETLQVPLEVNFSDGDEPLFIRLRVESAVAATFVIATTKGDRTGLPNATSAPAAQGSSSSASGQPNGRTDQVNHNQDRLIPAAGARLGNTATQGQATPNENRRLDPVAQTQTSTQAQEQSHPRISAESTFSSHGAAPMESTPLVEPPPRSQRAQQGQGEYNNRNGVDDEDEETMPLFFPGASQDLSSQLELRTSTQDADMAEYQAGAETIQPTPVSKGGDPHEFRTQVPTSQTSSNTHSSDEDDEDEEKSSHQNGPRKRFQPLF